MTQSTLFRLAYVSRPVPGAYDIEEILATARRKNAQLGITGALGFSGDWFVQVLEGPRRPVSRLFATIMTDPRHTDVELLGFSTVARRRFADWTMAYAADSRRMRTIYQRCGGVDAFAPDKLEVAAISELLEELTRVDDPFAAAMGQSAAAGRAEHATATGPVSP